MLSFFYSLSLILTILAKKYNIWSWLLSKITFGKFKYNEIEENKGSIVPQKSDNENKNPFVAGTILNKNRAKMNNNKHSESRSLNASFTSHYNFGSRSI